MSLRRLLGALIAWLVVVLSIGPAWAQYGAYPTAPNSSAPNNAKTMHISPTGNDTGGTGTVSLPFKTGQAAMNACGTTPCILQFDAGQTPGALIINPANPYVAVRGVGAASQISSTDNTTATIYDHPNSGMFAVREYSDISVMSNNFSYTGVSFDIAGSASNAYYMLNIANLTGGGTPSGASSATFQCINDVNVFASDLGNTTYNEINYARVMGDNYGAINSIGNVTVRWDSTQSCLGGGSATQSHFDFYNNRQAGDLTLTGTPYFLGYGNVVHNFVATSLAVTAGGVQPVVGFQDGQTNGSFSVTAPTATGSGGAYSFDGTTFYVGAPTLAIASGTTRVTMSFNAAKFLAGTFTIGDYVDVTANGAHLGAAISTTGSGNTGTITDTHYAQTFRSPAGYSATVTSGIADSGSAVGVILDTVNNFNTNGDAMVMFKTGGTEYARLDNNSGNGRRLLFAGGFPVGAPAAYIQHPTEISMGLSGGGSLIDVVAGHVRIYDGSVAVENNGGNWRPTTDIGSALGDSTHRWTRLYQSGTAPLAGNFALSAGWGSTASVGTIAGSDSHGSAVVTSAGTGQAASPTIAYTFKNGTWTTVPSCYGEVIATTDSATQLDHALVPSSTSATVVTFTWNGTPVATKTYTFAWECWGN